MLLSRALIALALLVSACSSPGSSASGGSPSGSAVALSKDDAALASAKSAASKLGTTVRTKLVDAMNAGGAANAIQVCSKEAPSMAAQITTDTGVRVGRSSLKLRNAQNAPPGWVQTWLLAQGGKKADQTTGMEGVFEVPGGRVARFLKPIAIEGLCLSCHGDPSQIEAPVKALLADKYPDDKATAYAVGDLRGALWAEVPIGK